jgi:hypothetical protein
MLYDDAVLASCVCCPKERERERAAPFLAHFSHYKHKYV